MTYVWKCKRTCSSVAWRMCGSAREHKRTYYVVAVAMNVNIPPHPTPPPTFSNEHDYTYGFWPGGTNKYSNCKWKSGTESSGAPMSPGGQKLSQLLCPGYQHLDADALWHRPLEMKNLRPKWKVTCWSFHTSSPRCTAEVVSQGTVRETIQFVLLLVFTGSSLAKWRITDQLVIDNFRVLFSQVHPWHVTMLGWAKACCERWLKFGNQIFLA